MHVPCGAGKKAHLNADIDSTFKVFHTYRDTMINDISNAAI